MYETMLRIAALPAGAASPRPASVTQNGDVRIRFPALVSGPQESDLRE